MSKTVVVHVEAKGVAPMKTTAPKSESKYAAAKDDEESDEDNTEGMCVCDCCHDWMCCEWSRECAHCDDTICVECQGRHIQSHSEKKSG